MAPAGYAIYKRCVPGDRRKVEAHSQDASTGGGARDIRLNPLATFAPVIPKVFTRSRTERGGREVHSAPVYWWEDHAIQGPVTVEIWGPTDARRMELRLSRVHEVTPFDENHIPPQKLDPFFLIWTDDEDRVWARYVTTGDMRRPGWAPQLVEPILDSVAHVPANRNIRGWINLKTGETHHHDAR